MNTFNLDEEHYFDIFKKKECVIPHKRSEISFKNDNDPCMVVKYDKLNGLNSSGFRISFQTKKDCQYVINTIGLQCQGDKSFIYCESQSGTRIVPRVYVFTKGIRAELNVKFQAVDELTWIGILFFSGSHDNVLEIYNFTVNQVVESKTITNIEDPLLCIDTDQSLIADYVAPIYPRRRRRRHKIQLMEKTMESPPPWPSSEINSNDKIQGLACHGVGLTNEIPIAEQALIQGPPVISNQDLYNSDLSLQNEIELSDYPNITYSIDDPTTIDAYESGFVEFNDPNTKLYANLMPKRSSSSMQTGRLAADAAAPGINSTESSKPIEIKNNTPEPHSVNKLIESLKQYSKKAKLARHRPLINESVGAHATSGACATSGTATSGSPLPRFIIALSTQLEKNALSELKHIIDSISHQTLQPDSIYVSIPYNFPTGTEDKFQEELDTYTDIPAWLKANSLIRITRCPNDGELTKILGILPLETDMESLILALSHPLDPDTKLFAQLFATLTCNANSNSIVIINSSIDFMCKRSVLSGANLLHGATSTYLDLSKHFNSKNIKFVTQLLPASQSTVPISKINPPPGQISGVSHEVMDHRMYSRKYRGAGLLNRFYGDSANVPNPSIPSITARPEPDVMEKKNNQLPTNLSNLSSEAIDLPNQLTENLYKIREAYHKDIEIDNHTDEDKAWIRHPKREIKAGKFTISIDETYNMMDKIAVIVEARADEFLLKILEHFIEQLDNTWKIQLFHGLLNKNMINTGMASVISEGRLILTEIAVNNLSRTDYSQLLLTKEFWKACMGHRILIFQMDTCLNPKARMRIDEFLEWDYIGGPWDPKHPVKSLINSKKKLTVGSGGFSLRNRSIMISVTETIAKNYPKLTKYDEDIAICSVLLTKPYIKCRVADIQTAKQFVIEKIYEPNALGVHCAWKYLKSTEISRFKKDYPSAVKLFTGKYMI